MPVIKLRCGEWNGRRKGLIGYREKFGKLTEKEKKKIESLRAPRAEDVAAHKEFLLQPGTGIVRLLAGYDCESKYVVKVDGSCANSLPGGSFHRFREDSISGDIVFMDGAIVAEGFFSNSIMTGLGDIALDKVTAGSPGMGYLVNFTPGADVAEVKKQYLELRNGVQTDGFHYANSLNAIQDMTYALRIVAYRNGNNVQKRLSQYELLGVAPPAGSQDMMFLALKDDRRIDLTVIFRVIRKDTDGSITLIWKEFEKKDSPEITFPGKVALVDFK